MNTQNAHPEILKRRMRNALKKMNTSELSAALSGCRMELTFARIAREEGDPDEFGEDGLPLPTVEELEFDEQEIARELNIRNTYGRK
jgi:hypothetical protein